MLGAFHKDAVSFTRMELLIEFLRVGLTVNICANAKWIAASPVPLGGFPKAQTTKGTASMRADA